MTKKPNPQTGGSGGVGRGGANAGEGSRSTRRFASDGGERWVTVLLLRGALSPPRRPPPMQPPDTAAAAVTTGES